MSEERKQNGWLWVFVAILTLLVSYPLSIGPMAWLAERNYFSESVLEGLELVYLPVTSLGDRVPLLGRLLEGYVQLFLN